MTRRLFRHSLIVWFLLAGSVAWADEPTADRSPVLLVHGMAWKVDQPKPVWGTLEKDSAGRERWTGLIGLLDARGYAYGGLLQARLGRFDLPDCLATEGVRVDPRKGRLFVLDFSPSANTDGLAHKGLELAEAIKQLCRFTGAKKIDVVAHSAGGLAARTYLQGALPGVGYRGDVDRLVTIATPHLGAAIASKVGDLVGTRATSLKPDAPLIEELNQRFDLPADVRFASIVVRGSAADVRGKGDAYQKMVDGPFVARLPVDYREGGDQVVHVLSQNLRLAPCAERYEKASGRPVQYMVVRVDDPSHSSAGRRVHDASPMDERVERLVGRLLDEDFFWTTADPEKRSAWLDEQARLHAASVIEWETLDEHSASEVKTVELDRFERVDQKDHSRTYAFEGKARSANRVIRTRRRETRVQGTLELEFDAFGRVVAAQASVTERRDL
jgi:hypothetical protein